MELLSSVGVWVIGGTNVWNTSNQNLLIFCLRRSCLNFQFTVKFNRKLRIIGTLRNFPSTFIKGPILGKAAMCIMVTSIFAVKLGPETFSKVSCQQNKVTFQVRLLCHGILTGEFMLLLFNHSSNIYLHLLKISRSHKKFEIYNSYQK